MRYKRIFAIPDIHGRADLLKKAWGQLCDQKDLSLEDAVIILGDMIDRGPDSRGVIERVMGLCKLPNVVALYGNHEDLAVKAHLHGGSARDLWHYNGGARTEDSYPGNRMSEDHIRFIASLPQHLELQGFYFSHAPVPRDKHRKGSHHYEAGKGKPGEKYTQWEKTWMYPGPGRMTHDTMTAHEGPRADDGRADKHLIGICGHIHQGPDVHEIREFPMYRMLDCGAGCFESNPLAVHECILGETFYVRGV